MCLLYDDTPNNNRSRHSIKPSSTSITLIMVTTILWNHPPFLLAVSLVEYENNTVFAQWGD